MSAKPICLGALGKPFIHFFFVGEQLLDARALLHALEMRHDVGEAGDVHLQLGGAPAAPKEMRVRGGEMVEEVFTPGKQIVADLKILEQSFGGELDDAVGRAACVADFGRVVDPAQKGVNAAGTPAMQRNRLQLVPRIGGQNLRVGKGSMDPLMDGDVLVQYFAVDHERRHLVFRVDLQVLGREILPLAEIERPDLEIGARFGQRHIGSERAGIGGVVKSDFIYVSSLV